MLISDEVWALENLGHIPKVDSMNVDVSDKLRVIPLKFAGGHANSRTSNGGLAMQGTPCQRGSVAIRALPGQRRLSV